MLIKNVNMIISKANINGFTLVELMIVVAVIGLLSAIAVPIYTSNTESAKIATDQANLRILNSMTTIFRANNPVPDPFLNENNNNNDLMLTLINNGYLNFPVESQVDGKNFQWNFNTLRWSYVDHLEDSEDAYVLLIDNVTFNAGRISEYTGDDKDIFFPSTLDGELIKEIYQDVFKEKGLKSINFADHSSLERIHARAFRDNELTEIVFPDSLKNIDTYSFENNKLQIIALPVNLEKIESHAFKNNELQNVVLPDNLEMPIPVHSATYSGNTRPSIPETSGHSMLYLTTTS
jgi:prepilin-type N-terminal cleavage/methylation domain-containing protein